MNADQTNDASKPVLPNHPNPKHANRRFGLKFVHVSGDDSPSLSPYPGIEMPPELTAEDEEIFDSIRLSRQLTQKLNELRQPE